MSSTASTSSLPDVQSPKQLGEGNLNYYSNKLEVTAKFFRLSHDVVTCDVDRDISTVHALQVHALD